MNQTFRSNFKKSLEKKTWHFFIPLHQRHIVCYLLAKQGNIILRGVKKLQLKKALKDLAVASAEGFFTSFAVKLGGSIT